MFSPFPCVEWVWISMTEFWGEKMRKVKWHWHLGSWTYGSLNVRGSLSDLDRIVKICGPFPEETWFSSLRGKWMWPWWPWVGLEWFPLHLGLNLPVSYFSISAFPVSILNSQVSWNRSKDSWAVTEQKMLESNLAVCPYWVMVARCTGRVQGKIEKAFYYPFLKNSIEVEGIFFISHKIKLCGSISKMLVVPKWP